MSQTILLNRAKMTVSGNPGTGAMTLLAAVPGYQTFAAAGAVDQMLVSYVIEQGTSWEIGQGTYTASGTSLARTTIIASSNGGATVSFNSTALVYIDALANTLTPAYQLDGLDPVAVFSAPRQAFYLNGASVLPTALFTWSSAAKYCTAANGSLYLVSANQPAWDWSCGYERLLVEAVAATNLYLHSQAPAGQTVTVTNATAYTVSFYGTGSITLSGAATQTVSGTGANVLTSYTFTSATTSLVMSAPTGSVTNVQVETGSVATSRIVTVGSPVTRVADVVTATAALPALLQAAGVTLVLRGQMITGQSIIGSTTAGAGVRLPPGANYVIVYDSSYNGLSPLNTIGATNTFGVAIAYSGASTGRTASDIGGAVVSDAYGFFTSSDTGVQLAKEIGIDSANVFFDEVVVFPFKGSNPGVNAQARIYS